MCNFISILASNTLTKPLHYLPPKTTTNTFNFNASNPIFLLPPPPSPAVPRLRSIMPAGAEIEHGVVEWTSDGVDTNKVVQICLIPRSTQLLHYLDMFLRMLCMVLTLVAMVVMASDKQTKDISVIVSDAVPPLQVPVSAKWHYLSSNVFFVVSNAIACSHAAGSLLHSIMATIRAQKHQQHNVVIIIVDVVMMSLLLSANGAVGAAGFIAMYGNSHAMWTKVCNVFGHFCHNMIAAFALSMLASLVLLLMVTISLVKIHKIINSCHK